MKTIYGCIIAFAILLVAAIVVAALAVIPGYNRLVNLSQSVDAQWAQVQNVYQRRADLIPNLVKTVSGAANFEKSTLTDVVTARASVGKIDVPSPAPVDQAQIQAFDQAQGALGSALSRLLVVVERYPELKANANFQALQAQLEGTENRISVERGRFNEAVKEYNTAVRKFPMVYIAPILGFLPKPYFTSSEGSAVPPNVDFDFGTQASPSPAPVPSMPPVPSIPATP